jgi:diadenosine tetraphosphate (Ap4A) HIT family hydrolase
MSNTLENYENNLLSSYEHWTTYLHPSQAYLGRSYIALNREGYLDPYRDTTKAEKYELDVAVNDIYVALMKLYKPDKFDYTNFGNEWKHCHLHVIPRYKTPREVNNEKFEDNNWGGNYSPYEKNSEISAQTFDIIKGAIKSELRTF